MNQKTSHLLLAGLTAMLIMPAASADIRFQDVSSEAGMTGFTESWGSSWGDLNGDNRPDLWIQGHNSFPRIYRNTGEGRFEDLAYEIAPSFWFDRIKTSTARPSRTSTMTGTWTCCSPSARREMPSFSSTLTARLLIALWMQIWLPIRVPPDSRSGSITPATDFSMSRS